jgi:hypothetical protein
MVVSELVPKGINIMGPDFEMTVIIEFVVSVENSG